MKTRFIRRGQPHIQPIGACFSVTILVYDAIPRAIIKGLQIKRQAELIAVGNNDGYLEKSRKIHHAFEMKIEELLHAKNTQEYPFRNVAAAEILMAQIQKYAGSYYHLLAVCVMPNHVHLLLDFSVQVPQNWDGESKLLSYENIPSVIKRIKGASARLINRKLNRKGPFWNTGYYDRLIRNQRHLENEKNYILNNAYKAGLVRKWNDYPFLYPKD